MGFGPSGPAGGFDPVRRVLTFTTRAARQGSRDRRADQARALRIVDREATRTSSSSSPSSTRSRPKIARKGLNPASQLVTKGWLRASHRALDAKHSTEMEPYHAHTDPQPLKPGEVYRSRSASSRTRTVQEGQPHPPRDRERRLADHRCAVDALLPAEQDRPGHGLSQRPLPLPAHPACHGMSAK